MNKINFEVTLVADLGDRNNGKLNYIRVHHISYCFFECKCVLLQRGLFYYQLALLSFIMANGHLYLHMFPMF